MSHYIKLATRRQLAAHPPSLFIPFLGIGSINGAFQPPMGACHGHTVQKSKANSQAYTQHVQWPSSRQALAAWRRLSRPWLAWVQTALSPYSPDSEVSAP